MDTGTCSVIARKGSQVVSCYYYPMRVAKRWVGRGVKIAFHARIFVFFFNLLVTYKVYSKDHGSPLSFGYASRVMH